MREKNFDFQLEGCRVIAGADLPLVCDFRIRSHHTSERKLGIHGYASGRSFSRVIDLEGNEILAGYAELGRESSERSAETYIPEGIPVKASLYFESIPERGIALIDIGCYLYGNGGGSFDVQFELYRDS